MKLAAIRLALALVLFVGWLGYLAFQVVTRPQTAAGYPLVLSRPQILASKIDVVADVPDKDGEVTIQKVLYPSDSKLKPGDKIKVTNIADCRPPLLREKDNRVPLDWTGPGSYLLPLIALSDKKQYEVMPIPPSPGFPANSLDEAPPRIYPANPEALAQYREIAKPEE